MNTIELEKIKQKALEEHIPIIMDDTLEVVAKILEQAKPKRILVERTLSICALKYIKKNKKSVER